jgi:hypothetical protein
MAEAWLMRDDAAKALNEGKTLNVVDLNAERLARIRRKCQDVRPVDSPTIAALKQHLATLLADIAKVEAIAARRRDELATARKRTDDMVAQRRFLAKLMTEIATRADWAARPWWRRING